MCGSTTWSTKPAATAASKALPPFSSTAMPTWLAIQCVDDTTPKVPRISGRVVNPGAAMSCLPFGMRGPRSYAQAKAEANARGLFRPRGGPC